MSRVSFSAVVIVLVGTIAAACGSNNSNVEVGPGDGGVEPDTSGAFNDNDASSANNCKPLTCQDQGLECGPAGDGCGNTIQDCGQCGPGLRCGGPGAFSKCVNPTLIDGGPCTPKT